ncbi:MAG: hypothetical protein RIR70_1390 [Pseudomonadota bacterium]|jgi:hypothetical protein
MSQHVILTFERFKYLKWAGLLCGVSILAYILHEPPVEPNGGTWLGYTLGTIGALLIVWLLLFGVRKRAYQSNLGTVRGWLSAHVYLGLALALVATLHAGFEFGWNVHTLAYVLTMAVIASGVWGVVVYARNPSLMSDMLGGRTLQQHGASLRETDAACRALAKELPVDIQQWVAKVADSPIFESRWQEFSGRNAQCVTAAAIAALSNRPTSGEAPAQRNLVELNTALLRRARMLDHIRSFVRLKRWVEVWLMFHVPLSLGLLASLIAHIVSVFIYW